MSDVTQDPKVFAEAVRRLSVGGLTAPADMLYPIGLKLDHPDIPLPPGAFHHQMKPAELLLVERMVGVLKHLTDFGHFDTLRAVNADLAERNIRFLIIKVHMTYLLP